MSPDAGRGLGARSTNDQLRYDFLFSRQPFRSTGVLFFWRLCVCVCECVSVCACLLMRSGMATAKTTSSTFRQGSDFNLATRHIAMHMTNQHDSTKESTNGNFSLRFFCVFFFPIQTHFGRQLLGGAGQTGLFFRSRTHESWEKKKPAKPNENKETYSPLTRAILLTGPDGVRSSELTSCPSDEGHFLPFKIYETVVLGPLFPTAVVLLSAVRGMPNQHQPVLSPRLVPVEYIFKRMKLSQIRYQLLRILFYMGSRSLL